MFALIVLAVVMGWGSCLSACDRALAIPGGVLIGSGLDVSFVARFALFIAVVLLWTVSSGKLLKRFFRLPSIAGQIIGGIVLGPSLINIQGHAVFSQPVHFIDMCSGATYWLLSSDLFIFFIVLLSSALTVSYLMWIAGHETDIKDILSVGVTATSAGILGAILPIISVAGVITIIWPDFFSPAQVIGLGIIFSATSVSIPVAMLFAYNKMHLKSSKATMGAAIIDDIVAVILLSVFFICLQSEAFGVVEGFVSPAHTSTLTEALLYMVASFVTIFSVGYFIIPPLVSWLQQNHRSHLIASVANGTMLMYFAFAELVGGLAGITGAYFAGLFHRMGDTRHRAEKVISPFVNATLLPLFLGSIGLQLNVRLLSSWHQWVIVVVLLIVAILSKLAACYLATALSNVSGRRSSQRWSLLDGYLFGSSMVARGEVGLVIGTILYGSHILSQEQYVIAVVVIVLTTIAAPIMLALGFTQLDIVPSEKGYRLNIGTFSNIGTVQMFNIIISRIEAAHGLKTTIRISEGRKVVSLQKAGVKIILCPEDGVIFEGNREKIEEIMRAVKSGISDDLEKLFAHE